MFSCCCAGEVENGFSTIDALPALSDTRGLVGIGKGAPPPEGDVVSLVVAISDSQEVGQLFDSCGTTSIHIPRKPREDSDFGRANALTSQGRGLQEGDYIVSINGVAGDASQMIQEALSRDQLDVHVSRPFLFKILADKTEQSLGCVINFDLDTGSSLLIEGIRPGALQTWNKANPSMPVKASDRIVAVDSARGTGTQLLDRIKARKGVVELLISRPLWLPASPMES